MTDLAFFTIFLIISVLGQGFFTMSEMAFLSFNRIKLAYYVGQGQKKAMALQKFFDRPGALFGTTLIGVNFFLQLGSECGRRVFFSLGLDPDYAYLPQLIIVLIFAEFFPMIAARDYAYQISMWTIRPITFFSKVFFPAIYLINIANKGLMKVLKTSVKLDSSISREELKSLMKDNEGTEQSLVEDLEPLIENIFSLRGKTPRDIMTPIKKIRVLSYDSKVSTINKNQNLKNLKYIPLYREEKTNIVAFAYAIDLLSLGEHDNVNKIARTPWYVVESNSIFQIINQFKKNNQKQAVVLDKEGSVVGIISLSQIVQEIFAGILLNKQVLEKRSSFYINRAFLATTKLKDISKEIPLYEKNQSQTLLQLMTRSLGYPPKDQETISFGDFELIFESSITRGDEKIRIRSLV